MKKILPLLIAITTCIATACSPATNSTSASSTTILDLRNKNSSGISVTRTITNNGAIGVFLEKDLGSQSFGSLTDTELENIVSFSDAENGFTINYTTPESLRDYQLMTRIIYIDNNNNWSTRQNIEQSAINITDNTGTHVRSSYSWVYPLVVPGRTYKFAIQFQYSKNGVTNPPDFQLYYHITPQHGIGIIDDLPRGYKSSDYTNFSNGVFSLQNVIPVESEVPVQKSIGMFGTNSSTEYWTHAQWFDGYDEAISNEPNSAITVDMRNRTRRTSDCPYMFFTFMYKYNLEDFNYCNFQTPEFTSKIIENTYFRNN